MARRRTNGEGTYFRRGTKWVGRVTTGYDAWGTQKRKEVVGDKLTDVRATGPRASVAIFAEAVAGNCTQRKRDERSNSDTPRFLRT